MRAVNLIPGDQLPGGGPVAGRSQGAVYGVLVLLGGLALMVFLYGKAHRQVASRTAEVASLNAKVAQAQSAASGLSAYTSFVALREERERAVAALIDQRFDWAHVYRELGRVLPRGGASISSIDGTVGSSSASGAAPLGAGASSTAGKISSGGAAATSAGGATPAGSVPTINLSGCATSQSEVAIILNRLRLIDGVNEVTLQSSSKSSSGAASSGSGSCPAGAPAFAMVLTFDPLPAGGASSAVLPVSATRGAR